MIHHPAHVERVERAAQKAPSYLDPDTVVSSESYRTGLYAAGGVLECVDAICSGNLTRGFAFVRPPGHHAEPNKAMGFCLFNNVALAAAYARQRYGLLRIAVVDIDLHHGNGTQAAFYDDPGAYAGAGQTVVIAGAYAWSDADCVIYSLPALRE